MADPQQANALTAAFPNPPPFYHYFSSENLEHLESLKAEAERDGTSREQDAQTTRKDTPTSSPAPQLLELPPHLRCLQPPAEPANGMYRSFGDPFNLGEGLPSLESAGIEQVYTPPGTPSISDPEPYLDRALILKRIAKSLLLNFLELMGIMSINPEGYAEKIQDIRKLFINFHHLLNEYRPHQARESLILLMEDRLERSRSETEGIRRMKAKVEEVLSNLGQSDPVDGEVKVVDVLQENGVAAHDGTSSAIWDDLRKEFGSP